MSGLEIERKFLVCNDDYKRQAFKHNRIQQGFICRGHGRTVRVRIRDDRGYLTIKGPRMGKGFAHYEFEKEITLEEAEHLREIRSKVASDTGVPAEMLTETTEEALKEQAEAILRFAGRDKYPVIKDGGEARRLCKKTTAEQFSEWASTQFK